MEIQLKLNVFISIYIPIVSDSRVFLVIYRHLAETGSFKKNTNDAGRPRAGRISQI